jgi:hypothetical protein
MKKKREMGENWFARGRNKHWFVSVCLHRRNLPTNGAGLGQLRSFTEITLFWILTIRIRFLSKNRRQRDEQTNRNRDRGVQIRRAKKRRDTTHAHWNPHVTSHYCAALFPSAGHWSIICRLFFCCYYYFKYIFFCSWPFVLYAYGIVKNFGASMR